MREGKIMGVPTEAAILAVSHMVSEGKMKKMEGKEACYIIFAFFCIYSSACIACVTSLSGQRSGRLTPPTSGWVFVFAAGPRIQLR